MTVQCHYHTFLLFPRALFLSVTSVTSVSFLCFSPLFLFSLHLFFFLHPPSAFLCWVAVPLPVRRRPGIYLCPSSPTLSTGTDTLPLPGSGSVGCGKGSATRATTPPPPSTIHSDSALLRKSVSFTEDLLLAASGIVGLLCVINL